MTVNCVCCVLFNFTMLSDGQLVSVTEYSVKALVRVSHMNAAFQCGERSLHRTAFYDAIAGPTEFIISNVNSVKLVNMPLA